MQLHPIHHQTVDSTNERALAAIADGSARHGDLHLARAQTAGRGRRGRRWLDEPGASVLASVVLLPERPLPHPEVLTMAAGLALLDTVRGLGLSGAELDWPNDLVVHGAKLAGVLVESRGYDPARPHHVVGIGLNVAQRRFDPALTAERAVTSLALEGLSVTREAVEGRLAAVLGEVLSSALDDPEGTAATFARALGLEGRAVRVTTADAVHEGRFEGLTLDGGLALAGLGGRLRLPLAHVAGLEPTGA